MALVALAGLRRGAEHRVGGAVELVTAGAAQAVVVVRAAVGREPHVRIVAAEAHAVLRLDAGGGVRVEVDDVSHLAVDLLHARMRAAGAVAGLALQLAVAEGPARIGRHSVFRTEDAEHVLVAVAHQAGVGAGRRVVGAGGGRRLRDRRRRQTGAAAGQRDQ